jgi:methionyl-tRNA formyltransferase
MRSVILCVGTEKGLAVVRGLADATHDLRVAVTTFCEQKVVRSYDAEIRDAAISAGFRFDDFQAWRTRSAAIIREQRADVILCIGWKYLIPPDTASQVGGNVIVAHDSLLPRLRGFAPLPTALISGEKESGVTFLRACEKVDAGPIYWQKRFTIAPDDTIQILIKKTLPLYVEGSRTLLLKELPEPVQQDESRATYSIWRDESDLAVDWRLSAETICRTIRALGPPYLGARTTLRGMHVIIRRAEVEEDLQFAIRQPGKIWSIDRDGCPVVVCGTGMLKILQAENEDKTPALPFESLRQRFS